MSTTTIEQHHTKWSDLPTFAAAPHPGPVTVEDIDFSSDLTYLCDLLDAIEDQDDLSEIDACLDWPVDHAAVLLDAWRNPEFHISEAVQ